MKHLFAVLIAFSFIGCLKPDLKPLSSPDISGHWAGQSSSIIADFYIVKKHGAFVVTSGYFSINGKIMLVTQPQQLPRLQVLSISLVSDEPRSYLVFYNAKLSADFAQIKSSSEEYLLNDSISTSLYEQLTLTRK